MCHFYLLLVSYFHFFVFFWICAEMDSNGDVKKAINALTKGLFFSLLMFFMGALIPSKETVYIIAASQMGEEVIKTDEMKAVKDKVMQYLEEKTERENR